jgi:hypothetical protein
MKSAKILQFERLLQEYAAWRAVPEPRRAPAAAWWWGTALELQSETEALPQEAAATLDLAAGSTYAEAAARLRKLIAAQTTLARPAEFPFAPRSKASTESDPGSQGGADEPA